MTKKRFYKLYRALCVEYHTLNKKESRKCNNRNGIRGDIINNKGYAFIWSVLSPFSKVGKRGIKNV